MCSGWLIVILGLAIGKFIPRYVKFSLYVGGWFRMRIALSFIEKGIVTGADMPGVKNVTRVDVSYGWNGVGVFIPWIVFFMFEDTVCCAPWVIIPWVVPRSSLVLLPRIIVVGASVTIGIMDVAVTGITIGIGVGVGVTTNTVEVMMGVVGVTSDASVIDDKKSISLEVMLVTTSRSPKLGNDGI
ncbi:unnamed protein product [Lactuca virosa]|uniref:Uncharacterized protein n=1 Tax=Lactuca virosa TaxID=75947 RepID=A0AAU9MUV8_9ASTR|nr:unnamed protein product [Lactuca virosa]